MAKVSQEELIKAAIAGVAVITFPTDTVPALAARPDKAEAIFQTKQRPPDKPLILMGITAESLWQFVDSLAWELECWQQIARQYWPGALTLVLPASSAVPPAVNPTDPTTIGLRVPKCEIALEILKRTGPLATTSANLSGQPPLLTTADIDRQFPEVLTLKDAPPESGSAIPSTVVRWTKNGDWEILRRGGVEFVSPLPKSRFK
ncbi:L-threonylcarbamoyladenylate synthase [Arthrospira platensis BEA 1257B]